MKLHSHQKEEDREIFRGRDKSNFRWQLLYAYRKMLADKMVFVRFLQGGGTRTRTREDHHRVIAAALRPPAEWRRPVGRLAEDNR